MLSALSAVLTSTSKKARAELHRALPCHLPGLLPGAAWGGQGEQALCSAGCPGFLCHKQEGDKALGLPGVPLPFGSAPQKRY